MQEYSEFSAHEWIATRLVSAEHLNPVALKAVENFTLMWNVFEGLLCNNRANVKRLEIVAQEISSNHKCQSQMESLFRYYIDRYYNQTGFTDAFRTLNFRSGDREEEVAAILTCENPDFKSKVFALLIILYRIRNNLFHGLKSIDMLNRQAVNLNVACNALAIIIEAHGSHLK